MGAKASRERISREVEAQLLRKEITSLKHDNDSLRNMLKHEIRRSQKDRCSVDPPTKSVVSTEIANEIVEEMLADPNSNLPFVPDFLERQMEQKAILYLLSSLARAVDSTNIEILGHEIIMTMRPKQDEPKKRSTKPISCSESESGSGSLTREIRKSFEESTFNISEPSRK